MAAGFFAGAFLATAGFAAALVAGFLAAAGFVAAGVFVAAALGAAVFLPVASFTPAALAAFERLALRRAAVFFSIRFYFTAVSNSL